MSTGRDDKSERRYERIRENAKEHGVSDQLAEVVAARASHRGEHSRSRSQGPTKDQLYQEARKRHIDGRSTMTKDELREALGR
ncbi:plasmid stabilization protein [Streptomyces adustus]|uniref:Plasmid stabilization protein n=1 Tax=Streptomyces adustus TaxID=1609272 RepID=A0A5N8V9B3_9ACTN|nr:plasmid stabilization protein [Streptomyces adustus]